MEPRLNSTAFAREFVQQRRSVIRVEFCKLHLPAQDVGKNDVNAYYYCMQWTAEAYFWRRQSVFFWFVYEISRELLNGFASNSHGRRVWSLPRTSLKVKVKGQGHQG